MANTIKDPFTLLIITLIFLLTVFKPGTSQNCGCAPGFCCSSHGYCGQTEEYCGAGCKEGPCSGGNNGGGNSGGDPPVSLEETVTPDFFNSIKNQAGNDCVGKAFYTREAFFSASNSYPSFGSSISKREIAAFFAHVTHETGSFCHTEEIDGPTKDYCDEENTQYPCAQGKGYYGRGPIQLSWNYNYGQCGKDLNEDILASPEKVAQDPALAFKTAFWFWTTKARGDFINQGFGASIRAVNSIECDGKDTEAVASRVQFFKDYCERFGVVPGEKLSC